MNNLLLRTILAGLVGTAVMTAFMMIGAAVGMPEMNPPQMLATTMGTSVAIGWVMHFMIGVVFALLYTYVFQGWLTGIGSVLGRGAAFGVIAFVLAQIGMMVMGALFPAMPAMSGNMVMMMVASLLGHVVFGIAVAYVVHGSTVAVAD